MPKRLSVSLNKRAAMKVSRVSIGKKKLVYLIVVPKPLRYPWGRSRLGCVGSAMKGVARSAGSPISLASVTR